MCYCSVGHSKGLHTEVRTGLQGPRKRYHLEPMMDKTVGRQVGRGGGWLSPGLGDPAVPLGQQEGNHSENLFPLQESPQPSSHAPRPQPMGSKQIVLGSVCT